MICFNFNAHYFQTPWGACQGVSDKPFIFIYSGMFIGRETDLLKEAGDPLP